MLRTLLFILFLPVSQVMAQNSAYIKKQNNSLVIGNSNIERVISIEPNHVGTTEIINKRSGKTYTVQSDVFAMQIVFSGIGPAYGKDQNGENDVILTARDFTFDGYKETDLEHGGKKLSLNFKFNWEDTRFRLIVNYEVYPQKFSLRKWIAVADSSYGIQFLDRMYVESMTFDGNDFSRGQFGQPVFNNDLFLGVEYPTVENKLNGNRVRIVYVVGKEIKKKPYVTHTSIIGAAPSKVKLMQTFMDYVDGIKVNGTRPYLLYNSWYDFRNPAIVKDAASVMNEKNVLSRIQTFKRYMYDKYNIALDAFVLDDGWDNYRSMWAIDSTRFPHGFTPLVKALKPMHTDLGIWASPICGYSNRDIRVKWGAEHGYEKTGNFLSFAGTKYKAAYKQRMVNYAKDYNLGYFKWDGFLLASNEPNQGHLPGIYSREANVSTYIDIINAVRKVNPDIFLNITTGTWLSPWWLKYADCIWMQGQDYGYAEDVPSLNDRDKAITYKDAVLWNNYRKLHLLFPMSSLMTHGIIKGRLNLLGGKNESLDSFSNEVMMYFGRGVMMWELYISPDLLSDGEWNAIASSIKWARANKNVLEKTRMILGNPMKRETYGYLHFRKDKGILLLRNPSVSKQTANIDLTPDLGDIDPSGEYYVKIIYPYNFILPKPVKLNQTLSINLDGYEVLAAELIPSDKMDKKLPVGVKYSINNGSITVFGEPGTQQVITSVGRKKLGDVQFGGKKAAITHDEKSPSRNNGSAFISQAKISIPQSYKNAKFGFLLESDKELLKDAKPNFEVKINGTAQKLTVEQEHGKWFWVTADLKPGENSVNYSITFPSRETGMISSWIISDEQLTGKQIGQVTSGSPIEDEILPAKPYPADIQKDIIPIKSYIITPSDHE